MQSIIRNVRDLQADKRRSLEDLLGRELQDDQQIAIRVLQTFASTLQGHRSGLLNWWDYPISTGPLEGTNNKIKTMQRQAYGYRDREFFELKILAIHQARYELVG